MSRPYPSLALGLVVLTALLVHFKVTGPAEVALAAARAGGGEGPGPRLVPLDRRPVFPGARWFAPEAALRALAPLPGGSELLVGGVGGAFVFDTLGLVRRPYELPLDLPANAVTAVALAERVPVLGHEAGGLTLLGPLPRRVVPAGPEAGRVRALAYARGRVFVGTAQGGLWAFDPADGRAAEAPAAPGPVRALAGRGDELLAVFGPAGALWLRGDAAQEAEPAGELFAACALESGVAWLGSDAGLWLWRPGSAPELVFATDLVTALAPREGGGVLVGTQAGRVLVARARGGAAPTFEERFTAPGPIRALAAVGRLVAAAGDFGLKTQAEGVPARMAIEPTGLAHGHVSALAVEPGGEIWAGTFDRGLERLDPAGRSLERLLSDDLWQVNRIVPADPAREPLPGVVVATSRGIFHRRGPGEAFERVPLGEGEGASPRYQDVLVVPGLLAVAGRDGLVFGPGPGALQAVSGYHGLPSNKAYALAAREDELWVGTLGGAALLVKGKRARTLRAGPDGLASGWVSALAYGRGGLFLGTYGGGLHWLPDGGTRPVRLAEGPREVNPGALLVVDGRLYCGSPDSGLWIFTDEGRGRGTIRAGLPAWDVQSLAAHPQGLLVGTTAGIVRIPWSELEGRV